MPVIPFTKPSVRPMASELHGMSHLQINRRVGVLADVDYYCSQLEGLTNLDYALTMVARDRFRYVEFTYLDFFYLGDSVDFMITVHNTIIDPKNQASSLADLDSIYKDPQARINTLIGTCIKVTRAAIELKKWGYPKSSYASELRRIRRQVNNP